MPFAPSAPTTTSARTRVAADAGGDAGVVDLDGLDASALAELGTGGRGVLGEERVESPALRHADQRLVVRPRERGP